MLYLTLFYTNSVFEFERAFYMLCHMQRHSTESISHRRIITYLVLAKNLFYFIFSGNSANISITSPRFFSRYLMTITIRLDVGVMVGLSYHPFISRGWVSEYRFFILCRVLLTNF